MCVRATVLVCVCAPVRACQCECLIACVRLRTYLCAFVCPRMRSRARVWAERTAVAPVIELPPWNVTFPPSMYTVPPSRCAHHPGLLRAAPATTAVVREPAPSHLYARAGDRRAVEHERALGHVHRPSV